MPEQFGAQELLSDEVQNNPGLGGLGSILRL